MMRVVLNTNALVQRFGWTTILIPLREALRHGRLTLAVSTPLLLEYEEVIVRMSGRHRWEDVWSCITLIDLLHVTIHHIGPPYRFHTIIGDADDDAFTNCAIAANADCLITSDHHFQVLISSDYKPQPITP